MTNMDIVLLSNVGIQEEPMVFMKAKVQSRSKAWFTPSVKSVVSHC
jgi:hypothetical protein